MGTFNSLVWAAAMIGCSALPQLAQAQGSVGGDKARVRYIVGDVPQAVAFYTHDLGFHLDAQSGPYFAMLSRGPLQLVLSPPQGPGGASRATPDGKRPAPGGWDRIILSTANINGEAKTLREDGAHFRTDVTTGPGGKQILLEDPAGNPIELFQPAAP
jgi:catechol 2,3-dioxygenase-like lactoylglutathione lyase family enzyme